MKHLASWLIGLLLVVNTSTVVATQIIHYDKKPITITLNVGEERTIFFGDHVEVGIHRGVKEKGLFRIQSAQGALHILANKQFSKQRVQVKRMTDKHVVLLDFITNKNKSKGSAEDIKLLMPHENSVSDSDENGSIGSQPRVATITPVDLTRYASQHLYGPSRLHQETPGISSSLITVKGNIKVFKLADSSTVSKVIFAVQGGGYYLSALLVKNTSNEKVQLDYLDINVPFSFATFQHHQLGANGTAEDSTVLYLISDKKMRETLYPWSFFSTSNANNKEVSK